MPAQVGKLLDAATAALRAGRTSEARRLARQALRRAPLAPPVLLVAGLAERASGNMDRAVSLIRDAAAADPGVPAIHQHLGVTLGMAGDWAGAATAFDALVRLVPREAAAHRMLGLALQNCDRLESARAAMTRAVRLAPNDPDSRHALAGILARLGAFDDAAEAYRHALGRNPAHPSAGRELGHLLNKMGRYADAVPLHRRELARHPDSIELLLELAYALAVTDGAAEAVDLLRRARVRQARHVPLLESLAFAEMRAGDPAACIATCDDLLAEVPDHTSALAYKSMALNELGRREEASFLIDTENLVHAVELRPPDRYDGIDDFNQRLVRELVDHPSLAYNPLNRSLRRGQSTGELFESPTGVIGDFRTMVERAVNTYTATHPPDRRHPFLARRPRRWRIGCWANIMDKRGFHDVHFHPPGWLSGVYYPEVPAVVDDPNGNGQGWIEFGRAYYQFRSTDNPPVRRVKPRSGLFVMFPSWFGHRTIPVERDERRISVAFDVMPDGPGRIVAGQER
ncbi:MAG: putative 2OG-Fe(II) oxygenase [Pseudomonadota bacterium]|nr:putative 2OG-Fe(II) oxygenase [Pseudomonadota bacterium]